MFVDEAFFAACPIDVATSLGLRKGLEMSDELERNLRKEDRRIVLRQRHIITPHTSHAPRNKCACILLDAKLLMKRLTM